MKHLVVGDPHILKKSLDKATKLFDQIESIGLPVILLGDQLDTKAVIDGYCLNFLYKRLRDSKLQWKLLVGNHDYFSLDECIDHSLEVLKSLPNVQIIDSPIETDGAWFVPYIHDDEKLRQVLSKIPKGSIVFGHFEIPEFDYGNGWICESGVPIHSFKKFKRVISGHFHKHQQKGNILYLGTAYSKDFGESNQDKFIAIYDPSTDDLELIPTNFPKHVTITVDVTKPIDYTLTEGDEIRFVLTGPSAEIASFQRIDGIRYDEKPDEDQEVLVVESEDHLNQFKNWANLKKVSEASITLGLEILKEVDKK